MNRIRSFVLIAIVALLAGVGVVAYAQGGPGGGRGFGGRGGPGGPGGPGGFGPGAGLPLAQLNLTQAQQDQVKQLVEQSRDQNQTIAQQMRAAMEAQRSAVETIPVDEGLIRSTTQALAESQADMAVQQAKLRAQIFALLTPDQQAKVKALEAQNGQRPARRRPAAQ